MKEDFRFLVYHSSEGNVSVNAVIKEETIWLSQKGISELFDVEIPAISKHLTNIFAEGELSRDSTVSKMETVQIEGGRTIKRKIDFYNLDAIISVGYRVNSRRATHFRIWVTGVLKEYMTKGFARQFTTPVGNFSLFSTSRRRLFDRSRDSGRKRKRFFGRVAREGGL